MTRKKASSSRSSLLDDGGGDLDLRINPEFARKYEEKKRTEELGILEDKYREKLKAKGARLGRTADAEEDEDEGSETSDSESDYVEDEDGELVTPAIDAQILRTLADIRARDPKVYDASVKFFDDAELEAAEEAWREKQVKAKDSQPMRLADYQRERLLSGKLAEDEEDKEEADEEEEPLTHYEEQERLKRDFQSAATADDEDDLFRARPKSTEQVAQEEEEYRAFLLENLSRSQHASESMANWLDYRRDQGAKAISDPNEQFLIDYVLNRGWIDQERKALPSMDRVLHPDNLEEAEDAEIVEKAEEFETALNFRFEQPGAALVQTYARQIEGTLRRSESKRKAERDTRQARKAAEKQQRVEELKRLKNLRKRELEKKLAKIKQVAGIDEEAEVDANLLKLDDESDFDPAEHDKRMAKLLAKAKDDSDEKPVFEDGLSDFEVGDDDDEMAMVIKTKPVTKATKALKKASKRAASEETAESLAERLEALYQLDYEDMIGELPCRFKYTSVPATAFGLSTEEILETDDALLNAHASLKRLAPYRPTDRVEADRKKLENQRRLYMWRKTVREAKKNRREARETAKALSLALKKQGA